jgi:hypothetical protein
VRGVHPARSVTLRRWFFTSILLALALLLVVRFTLVPNVANMPSWRQTLASTLDSLSASAVTSLIIGLAYVLLFPAEDASAVEVMSSSREIERVIFREVGNTHNWSVRARTANYFTKETLQRLTDAALSSGGAIIVRMQVLDPENENLISAYAKFRSNRPGAAAKWTGTRVRREIYAAILAAAVMRSRAPRVEIEIGFSPAFWVISLDISDNIALLTGQERDDPALLLSRGSRFFDGWSQDFEASFSECRRVKPELSPELALKIEKRPRENIQALREFFVSLGLGDCSDTSLLEVVAQAKLGHHYA